MLKIIVASENPVKIETAKQGFSAMFSHEQLNIKVLLQNPEVGKTANDAIGKRLAAP